MANMTSFVFGFFFACNAKCLEPDRNGTKVQVTARPCLLPKQRKQTRSPECKFSVFLIVKKFLTYVCTNNILHSKRDYVYDAQVSKFILI